MKTLCLKWGLGLASGLILFMGLSVSVQAQSLDMVPPEVGSISPATFDVRHLTTFRVSVSDERGVGACHLFVDGADVGRMMLAQLNATSSWEASLSQVFFTPATRQLQVHCEDMLGNVAFSPVTIVQAEAPETSAASPLPIGFSSGMLVRLSCLPQERGQDQCESLYYVGRDGKRHAFQSAEAFRSWYASDPSVMEISLAAMASLSLGSPISIKPGQAIQFLSLPQNVYVMTGPRQLRKFVSESVAAESLGADWKYHANVLIEGYYAQFAFGPDIQNKESGHFTVASPEEVL